MRILLYIVLFATVLCSCRKGDLPVANNMSINVINASVGVGNAKVKTPNATGYFNQLTGVNYGSNTVFSVPSGSMVGVFNSTDTTHPLFSNSLAAGHIYSLFIAGDSGGDIVLQKDTIPYHSDSTFGVRFVNLSVGSTPVSVNIQGNPNGSEVNSLSYKGITTFKSYSATMDYYNNGYTFEFRDATAGTLLASYNTADFLFPAVPLFQNITLILYGSPSNDQVMEVNNF